MSSVGRVLLAALTWPSRSRRWGHLAGFAVLVAGAWCWFHVEGTTIHTDRVILTGMLTCLILAVCLQLWLTPEWTLVGMGLFGFVVGTALFFGNLVPRVFGWGVSPPWVAEGYRAFYAVSSPVLLVGLLILAWETVRRDRLPGDEGEATG